jgi:hypothetical protein
MCSDTLAGRGAAAPAAGEAEADGDGTRAGDGAASAAGETAGFGTAAADGETGDATTAADGEATGFGVATATEAAGVTTLAAGADVAVAGAAGAQPARLMTTTPRTAQALVATASWWCEMRIMRILRRHTATRPTKVTPGQSSVGLTAWPLPGQARGGPVTDLRRSVDGLYCALMRYAPCRGGELDMYDDVELATAVRDLRNRPSIIRCEVQRLRRTFAQCAESKRAGLAEYIALQRLSFDAGNTRPRAGRVDSGPGCPAPSHSDRRRHSQYRRLFMVSATSSMNHLSPRRGRRRRSSRASSGPNSRHQRRMAS